MELPQLLSDSCVEQFHNRGAYGHSDALYHQNYQHGFPQTWTVIDNRGGLSVMQHYAYSDKKRHSQEKEENLRAHVCLLLAHLNGMVCLSFILFDPR
jgi:hypothetical protein